MGSIVRELVVQASTAAKSTIVRGYNARVWGVQNGNPGLKRGSAAQKAHELVTEQIRKEFPDHHGRLRLQLGAEVVGLADDLRLGLLRDRDDCVLHRVSILPGLARRCSVPARGKAIS